MIAWHQISQYILFAHATFICKGNRSWIKSLYNSTCKPCYYQIYNFQKARKAHKLVKKLHHTEHILHQETLVPALPVGIKIPKPKPPPTQTQCEEKFTESYTILYLKVFNNCSLIVKLLEIPWWKVLNKSYILFIFTSVAVCLLHMTSSTNAYNEIFPLWNRYYAWIRTIFTSLG